MTKQQLGLLIREARVKKGMSLRQLAGETGIDYSRLARIEYGTRPAPGLPKIRLLADALCLEMSDLLVASGTSREVVEQLLWSERLRTAESCPAPTRHQSEGVSLVKRNMFDVEVVRQDGARSVVQWGGHELVAFSFSHSAVLRIVIPPESVLVFPADPRDAWGTGENILPARIKKVRRIGELSNVIVTIGRLELNALCSRDRIEETGLVEQTPVHVLIPAAAIQTVSTGRER